MRPVFLLEILSPTNEQDTRDNVWAYMTIPSVQQILLVDSTAVRGEMLRRGDTFDLDFAACTEATGLRGI